MDEKYIEAIYSAIEKISDVIKEEATTYFLNLPMEEKVNLNPMEILTFEMRIIFSYVYAHLNKVHQSTERKNKKEHTVLTLLDDFTKQLHKAIKQYEKGKVSH